MLKDLIAETEQRGPGAVYAVLAGADFESADENQAGRGRESCRQGTGVLMIVTEPNDKEIAHVTDVRVWPNGLTSN